MMRWNPLFAAVACLQLGALASATMGSTAILWPLTSFTVATLNGMPTTVYNFRTQHCPKLPQPGCPSDISKGCDCDIADAPVRAWFDGTQVKMLASVDLGSRYMVGESLNNLQHDCKLYANSTNDMDMSHFADHEWVHSSWYFPSNRSIYALTHNEYHCDREGCPAWPNATGLSFVSGVTLMESTDDGGSWHHAQPPPHHLVAAMPYKWNLTLAREGTYGFRSPSSIVESRHGDGFFYATVTANWGRNMLGQQAGACMMRTRDLTDPTAWRAWGGSSFNVDLSINPWVAVVSEPQPCVPFTNTTYGTLVWSSHYRRYLYFGTNHSDSNGWHFALSDDLVHWDNWTAVSVPDFSPAGNGTIQSPPSGTPMPGRFIQRQDHSDAIWWEDPTHSFRRQVGSCNPCPGIYACGPNRTRLPDAQFDSIKPLEKGFSCIDIGFKPVTNTYMAYLYPTLLDPSVASSRPNFDEVGQSALLFLIGQGCAGIRRKSLTQLSCDPFDRNGLLYRDILKVPVKFK